MATSNRQGRFPDKIRSILIGLGTILLAYSIPAACADLNGVVTSRRGLPLGNVKVTIKDMRGNVIKTVTTDKNGSYRASGLVPANYTCSVDGNSIGFRGIKETVTHVPASGVNVNWTMTSNNALATGMESPARFQMGADNASNFFSGMSGPIGSTKPSNGNLGTDVVGYIDHYGTVRGISNAGLPVAQLER